MSESARHNGSDSTLPVGSSCPDPAYADQMPYGPAPTQQFPTSPNNSGPFDLPPHEEHRRTAPLWLWIAAGLSVVLVLSLVVALVIINSNEQQTLIAPPPMPEPTHESTTSPRASTPSAAPIPIPLPMPGLTPAPSESTPPGTAVVPGEAQTVGYSVTGTGRVINITYLDTGNVLQTEFNVLLPWSKDVQLNTRSARSASVSIVNVGKPISCSISVDGTPVQRHTGMGLTVCTVMHRGFGR